MRWFAEAPEDRVTWWSYYHEPENDVAAERITSEIYKLAWDHIAALAETAQNPQLRSTLILMCWTANPASGRNWRDYYAGDVVIDVLAWDCYNAAARQGVYAPPAQIFDRVRSISESAGKPWGVAEFGSLLVTGDDGSARAAWLRSAVEYLRDNRALFVTYFDVKLRLDYRLRDAFSQAAWRDAVQGQWD